MTDKQTPFSHPYYAKISVDIWTDDKVLVIRGMPEGDAILLIFIHLITLAQKTNDDGSIYITPELPYTEQTLASVFGRPQGIVHLALETLRGLNLVQLQDNGYYFLTNFHKWQDTEALNKYKINNAKRQQEFRERQKNKQLTGGKNGKDNV